MKRYFLTIFASLLLGNCTYNVHTVDSDELNQTVALALYPLAQWDKPIDSTRTFIWEGREVTIKGREIQGVHDKDLDSDLLSEETDYADDDFWQFMLGGEKLKNMGYEKILVQEEKKDRQLVGLRSNDGYLLLLSSIVDYEDPDNFLCPCKYTFVVFTDDKRVIME
ncbi:MAG: hypothetical protein QF741_03435 [Candidatus Peribacteraceae bacterium]|jgi:hypothetical protein|nr:hypothetical protein [Candidatus Peribacteraceae bacterium]MDP7454051.1 hypothetical protein [Candidatus Peribacteraceae bacterium]|tara:strand:+ start:34 stop:531 length:498 start_codon:yes stop_codon:yes gene_type:complete